MTLRQLDDLKRRIRIAIRRFKQRDWDSDLSKVNIYEPTISHRIAVYLEKLFSDFHVDCEYNKHGVDHKFNQTGDKIRPDIIIHRRRTPINLVVFEVKKNGANSKLGKADIKKLEGFRARNYNYQLCVFVGVLKSRIEIVWFAGRKNKQTEILKFTKSNNGKRNVFTIV